MAKLIASLKPYIVSFLSDFGFKVTFGDRDSTLFARKAIELIIGEEQPIQSLTYLRNEFEGLTEDARSGLYDVICQDEHKRIFIVEMQVENYDDLLERLQFYGFHIFTTMVKKGKQGFASVGVVNCICIIKGSITDSTKYHQIVSLKNQDNEIVMDNIVFHLIELGKFPIGKKELAKVITEKEELLYTMKYAHRYDPVKDTLPPFWHKDFFQIALARLDTSRMTAMDVALYENALIRVRTVAQFNDKKITAAVEKAEKEAAKEAAEKATESVKKLLLSGKFTIEEIAEYIDVSVEFVKKVKKSLDDLNTKK